MKILLNGMCSSKLSQPPFSQSFKNTPIYLQVLENAILSPFVTFSIDFRGVQKSLKIVFFRRPQDARGHVERVSLSDKNGGAVFMATTKVETPSISVENYWSPSYSHFFSNKILLGD